MSNRTTGKQAARARAAEMRAAQARAERRRRVLLASGAIGAVVLVVAALVIAKLAGAGGGSSTTSAKRSTGVASSVVRAATSVPKATLDKVGAGGVQVVPARIDARPMTAHGKPRMLYIGAEYCPFCAAERWPVVVALSRFGSWSGLGATSSSAVDAYPNTQTLSFHGATYTSKYLSFSGFETSGNKVVGGQYTPLDTLTAADQKLFDTYDRPPYIPESTGGIPFIAISGSYVSSGASFSPDVLHGKSRAGIAAALDDPSNPIAQAVGATANVFTAAVCEATGNQPKEVCTSAGVKAGAAALAKGQRK
jgi:hypothetical protein